MIAYRAPAKSEFRTKLSLSGVNLGNALEAPDEGDWGVVLAAADFVSVKQAGFDHVRLPVRFSAHAAPAAPYAIDAAFMARVDWAIDQALANGLAIIVDLHHYGEFMDAPDAHRARLVGLWRQIAEHERARPPAVAFELCNEPTDKVPAEKWNEIQTEALDVVRASNPTRTVVLESVFWASAQTLRDKLRVPAGDPHVVASFHMYQPILFTHQGATFMPSEYETRGVLLKETRPVPPSSPTRWTWPRTSPIGRTCPSTWASSVASRTRMHALERRGHA